MQICFDTEDLETLHTHVTSAIHLASSIADATARLLGKRDPASELEFDIANAIDALCQLVEKIGALAHVAPVVPSLCSEPTEPAPGDDELTWPRVALLALDAPGGAS